MEKLPLLGKDSLVNFYVNLNLDHDLVNSMEYDNQILQHIKQFGIGREMVYYGRLRLTAGPTVVKRSFIKEK